MYRLHVEVTPSVVREKQYVVVKLTESVRNLFQRLFETESKEVSFQRQNLDVARFLTEDLRHASSTKPRVITTADWFLKVQYLPICIYKALAQTACRLSVKFGQALGPREASWLAQQIGKSRVPFQCVHGPTTIVPQPETKLGAFNTTFSSSLASNVPA